MVFNLLRGSVSRRPCKIERRSQLITNGKSYIGFCSERKSMNLSDLKGKSCFFLGNEVK